LARRQGPAKRRDPRSRLGPRVSRRPPVPPCLGRPPPTQGRPRALPTRTHHHLPRLRLHARLTQRRRQRPRRRLEGASLHASPSVSASPLPGIGRGAWGEGPSAASEAASTAVPPDSPLPPRGRGAACRGSRRMRGVRARCFRNRPPTSGYAFANQSPIWLRQFGLYPATPQPPSTRKGPRMSKFTALNPAHVGSIDHAEARRPYIEAVLS